MNSFHTNIDIEDAVLPQGGPRDAAANFGTSSKFTYSGIAPFSLR